MSNFHQNFVWDSKTLYAGKGLIVDRMQVAAKTRLPVMWRCYGFARRTDMGQGRRCQTSLNDSCIFFSSCFSSDFLFLRVCKVAFSRPPANTNWTASPLFWVAIQRSASSSQWCRCNKCIQITVHKNTVYGSWHLLPLLPDKSSGTAQETCPLIQWTRI